mmetsp:Transcript_101271/g.325457  ORF Transcript_101271/g.325457 Transcript_101271/m.325457 type:complete len:1383 (+) Transcript_101271:194-4342(+)
MSLPDAALRPAPEAASAAPASPWAGAARRMPLISPEDLGGHGTRDSLWVAIRGKVYDVTGYLAKHPGGAAILLQYGGRDATEVATAAHRGSTLAAQLMKERCIGRLAASSQQGAETRSTGAPSSLGDFDDVHSALASVQLASELAEDEGEVVVSGEQALLAVADPLYRLLRADPRLPGVFKQESLTEMALALRQFLSVAFSGVDGMTEGLPVELPSITVSPPLIEALAEELSALLSEVFQRTPRRPDSSTDPLLDAFQVLREELRDHPRVLAFRALLQAAVPPPPAADKVCLMAERDLAKAAAAASENIDVKNFGEFVLDAQSSEEVQSSWAAFLEGAASREAAGEAVFSALVDSAPNLRGLFKTPRAVMAPRFMNGLSSIVAALGEPAELKVFVETLGFRHVDFEVTVPHLALFQDAVLALLGSELGARLTPGARKGWRMALDYIGGALIHVRLKYGERLRTIASSWAIANSRDLHPRPGRGRASPESIQDTSAVEARPAEDDEAVCSDLEAAEAKVASRSAKADRMNVQVPRTFVEMFRFNSMVMGFSSHTWMAQVLDSFEAIVENAANTQRLQEECDVLSLHLAQCRGKGGSQQGDMELQRFRAVMLASLRSLLPQDWSSTHETAWVWLWESVEQRLRAEVGKPASHERALEGFIVGLTEGEKGQLRRGLYQRFFAVAPKGQNFFKQSTTRLHFIADRVVEMTLEMYRQPKKMVEDMSALGLRHVAYGIPTDLFPPFVAAFVEVVRDLVGASGAAAGEKATVEESFRWSLGLISRILVRTITEGSTIVMLAINVNSARQLRRAVVHAPRGSRAAWMLSVQVGTESISPLYSALERGSLEAAGAVLEDLLTIRADRDRYYYGADELFARHADVVNRLILDAPELLPKLFDGLVWRARTTEQGRRRVNYYLKHLLQTADGEFASTLRWLAKANNPKLACHPIVVLLSETLWGRLVNRTFLLHKSWFIFTLLVFILAQAVLSGPTMRLQDGPVRGWALVVSRSIIYCFNLMSLLARLCRRCVRALRAGETRRILGGSVRLPSFLLEDWQESFSLLLIVVLCLMLCLEPLLRCISSDEGSIFDVGAVSCVRSQSRGLLVAYSAASAVAMGLYFLLLLDLAAVSTRLSAFVLTCRHVVPEVLLFLVAVGFAVLAFSCAVAALSQSHEDFRGIPSSAVSFARIAFRMFNRDGYDSMQRREPALYTAVTFFVVVAGIFLGNLLVAQLNAAFRSVHEDMDGFARLNRAKLIAAWMPSVSARRWKSFLAQLRLEERLEFNDGDVGMAGGLQMFEPASAHPTTVESIRRFGGSTSPESPWPEEEAGAGISEEDRFDKLERTLEKAMKRKSSRAAGGGRGDGGARRGRRLGTDGSSSGLVSSGGSVTSLR